MNDREQDFVRKVRGELHRSLADLDDTTLARLGQGRRRALQQGTPAAGRHPLAWAGILGAVAASLLLLLTTVFSPFGQPGADKAIIAEMSLFTEEESFEFFSDIEFYEWLLALDGEDSSASVAPEQRKLIRDRFEQFQKLSPEKKRRLREARARFRQLPQEQRDELRQQWRSMTPEQRAAMRQKFRQNGAEQRQQAIERWRKRSDEP